MKYILDMNKWRCGGYDVKVGCFLGKGDTQMLNEKGYMCCLGQFGKQMGVSDNALMGAGEPSNVATTLFNAYDKNFVTNIHKNTVLACSLMYINDYSDTTIDVKIKLIREELEAAGHTLEVISKEE